MAGRAKQTQFRRGFKSDVSSVKRQGSGVKPSDFTLETSGKNALRRHYEWNLFCKTKPMWQARCAEVRGSLCKTNPIRGGGAPSRAARTCRRTPCGVTTSTTVLRNKANLGGSAGGSLGHIVRNKPNSARGRRAKQSQLPGPTRPEPAPVWLGDALATRCAEQSQCGGSLCGSPGVIMQNRPNSAIGRRVKTKPIPRRTRLEPTPDLIGGWPRHALCKTKPIAMDIQGQDGLATGAVQNKANCGSFGFCAIATAWGHCWSPKSTQKPCSGGRNAVFNAPGGTRTPNPQLRRLMLYPIKLQARRTT